jgi:hypothetical protein
MAIKVKYGNGKNIKVVLRYSGRSQKCTYQAKARDNITNIVKPFERIKEKSKPLSDYHLLTLSKEF